jgi:hypothetical protein
MLNWIAKWPLRKPLTVAVMTVALLSVIRAVWQDIDIPPNASDLLKVLVGVTVGGYVGSSAYEACNAPPPPSEREYGNVEED